MVKNGQSSVYVVIEYPLSLRVTQSAYLSLLTDAKQLLLMTFCDPNSGIVKLDRTPIMVRQRNAVGVKDFST